MTTNIKEIIGNRIKKYRNDRDMNQDALAKILDISRSTLSAIEKGESFPSTETLINMMIKLNIDFGKILKQERKNILVVDSNIMLKRPQMLDRVVDDCHAVYIPRTVVDEIEDQKNNKFPSKRKVATLCLNKIHEFFKSDKLEIYEKDQYKIASKNDESILNAAISIAEKNPADQVYLLTNDIDFKLMPPISLPNVKIIKTAEYDTEFYHDYYNEFNEGKMDRLLELIKRNSFEDIKKYDMRGININCCQSDGFTPLIQAVRQAAKKKIGSPERKESMKILSFLLKLDYIDLNITDETKFSFPPITHAVQAGDAEIVQLLLDNGADVNAPSINSKNPLNTPIMVACWHGDLELVKLLCENGACLNQQDGGNGFTPLIKAVFSKKSDIVKYLLDKNADKQIMSHERKTALDYAYEKRLSKIIEILKDE